MRLAHFIPKRLGCLAFLACWSILALGSSASAETASELLEKGIYTEETVGDLAEAIRVYEKVVTAGKNSQKAAAQAQFRIGLCYEKQRKSEQAAEAFQLVIDEYPSETDLVGQARSHLPADPELLPVPWGDGDELLMEMSLPTGLGVGLQVYRVNKLSEGGREMWECSTWQLVSINGQLGKSHVLVDQQTFAPIQSQWKHSMLGEARATYEPKQVVIKLTNRDEPTTLNFDGPVFDNEQCAEVFRRLPLKVNYKTKLNVVSSLGGAKVPISLHVTKMESIEVPAGTFKCFCLKLDVGQTFWISNDDHRYIVRFEAGGVVVNLTEIRHRNFAESTPLKRDHFATTLPPNWFAYTASNSEKDGKTTTSLIDSAGEVNSRIEAGPLESLQADHATPRAWLESSMDEYAKRLKDFTLSEADVQSVKIGEREAAVAVFEYSEGDQRLKARRITLFGDSSAVNLRFTTSKDAYDKAQPAIDKILANLVVE